MNMHVFTYMNDDGEDEIFESEDFGVYTHPSIGNTCVYICICVCIHVCMYTCIYTYTNTYTPIHR
jgi:hypothetical protein